MSNPKTRSMLRRYQNWSVRKIKSMWTTDTTLPGLILAYDMGSGKTASVLTALRDLLDSFYITKVLVVAPVLVAKTVWPDEIEDWDHLRALSYTLIRVEDDDPDVLRAGREASRDRPLGLDNREVRELKQRAEAVAKERKLARLASEDTEIHIINKEAIPWLWQHFGSRWPYDVVVIDEASMLKNGQMRVKSKVVDPKTGKERTIEGELSRFGALVASRKHTTKVIEMTGTPTPKGLENLWGLSYYIDRGFRLGNKKDAFMARWFIKNQYSRKIEPQGHAFDEIMGRLKDIMFSIDPADLDELPPMIDVPLHVKLPPEVLAEYKRFRRNFVTEEYDVEAVNAGVLHNKLLQAANGSLYNEDGEDVWIHDCKIDALKRIVEETDGAPLLVFYSYEFDLTRIRKFFPKATVLNEHDPRKIVKQWNAGELPMLLAHRASAGHGLNLQYGGYVLVQYGLTSDLELYLQANKRLLRPGQKNKVYNYMILAEGTLDMEVLPKYLAPKGEMQDRVLEATRIDLEADELL
jgi:SNF2 family DNA or RNA helicase